MKHNVSFYSIADNEIKIVPMFCELQEFINGDWSCDCRRSMLFSSNESKIPFPPCRCIEFLIISITDQDDKPVEYNTNDFNRDYNDTAKQIARWASTRYCGQKAKLDVQGIIAQVPAGIQGVTGACNIDQELDQQTRSAEVLIEKHEALMEQQVNPHPLPRFTGEYIAGKEFGATHSILQTWNPLQAVVMLDTIYKAYATTFVSWASKCQTPEEFAIQIAARFNHLNCISLNSNGQFEITKPQTFTTNRCLEIAKRIRIVCGIDEMLPKLKVFNISRQGFDPLYQGRGASVLWKG